MTEAEPNRARRPLEPNEQEVIEVLLGAAQSGTLRYIGQLERLEVVGTCGCGCSSINLELPSGLREGSPEPLVLADGEAADGTPVGVILWARGGALSGLEVHSWDGGGTVTLPRPETLINLRAGCK